MKQLKLKELAKLCQQAVKQGNGDKFCLVCDDNEGNGYHGMFYGVTPVTAENVEDFSGLVSDTQEKNLLNCVIIG